MQTTIVKRRGDGSIDFDHYRREARNLRTQAKVRAFKRGARLVPPALGAGALLAAYMALNAAVPSAPALAGEVPDAIAAPGEGLVATAHAVGAQIYECKRDSAGRLTWQFREPIASLFINGETVGRHYAGPSWEMNDGSVVSGKVVARASGARPGDIPLLKLNAAAWEGRGQLGSVTTIQRLNTRGGSADASCESEGAFLSVPYTADYAFYRKQD
jgi:Protein of unknown function (DUF3455)